MFQIGSNFLAPFQKLNVLGSGDAFLHYLQHLGTEALHARLDAANVRLLELTNLRFLQIRFHFPEQVRIQR